MHDLGQAQHFSQCNNLLININQAGTTDRMPQLATTTAAAAAAAAANVTGRKHSDDRLPPAALTQDDNQQWMQP